jgi:hypothetical protein
MGNMGNRAKSIFYSVLFNKFHSRTNLMAPVKILRVLKFDILRVPFIQIPTKKG